MDRTYSAFWLVLTDGESQMTKRFIIAAAATIALGGAVVSAPAQAAHTVCSASQLANAVGATACYFVSGNANSNSAADRALQQSAIGALGAATFTYDFGNQSSNSFLDGVGHTSLSPISFGTPLVGETIVGMHFGGGKKSPFGMGPGGFTAFYKFNFASPTNSIALLNSNSLSNAHLYAGGVPEPTAWALMIVGFGAVGATLRRRTATLRRFAIS